VFSLLIRLGAIESLDSIHRILEVQPSMALEAPAGRNIARVLRRGILLLLIVPVGAVEGTPR